MAVGQLVLLNMVDVVSQSPPSSFLDRLKARRVVGVYAQAAAIALLMVLVAGFVWWQADRAYREMRQQTLALAEIRGMQVAQAMGGQVAGLLASVDVALKQLRVQWDGNPRRLDPVVRTLLDSLPMGVVDYFSVADASGQIVYNSLDSATSISVADRAHFRAQQEGGDRFLIGQPIRSRLSGEWSFFVNRPMLVDGRFAGVVSASISNGLLARQLGELSLGQNDLIALMMGDGAFLARTLDNDEAMGRAVPADRPFLLAGSGQRGVFSQTGLIDQVDRLYAWHRVQPYGLVLAVGADERRLLAPVVEAHQRNLWTAGLLVLLMALASSVVVFQLLQTARRQLVLKASEAFRRRVFDSSPVPMVVVDPQNDRFIDCNLAAVTAYGFESRELALGHTLQEVSAPVQYDGRPPALAVQAHLQLAREAGVTVFEWRNQRQDGSLWDAEVHLLMFDSENRRLCQFTLIDITDRKLAEGRIQELVDRDDLTGLLNRRGFLAHLSRIHAQAARQGGVYALLFIDVDHFKFLNDSLGHKAGDAALVEIARRLAEHTRQSDLLARLGGDEFVLVMNCATETEAIESSGRLANKLLDILRAPLDLDGQTFTLSCSMGIAIGHDTGLDGGHEHAAGSADVLRSADLAMYSAKESGRNNYRYFDDQIQHRMLVRIGLEQDLRAALSQTHQSDPPLALHLQPIVDEQKKVLGYEALLRWERPGQGKVSPAEFIPIAEQSGLMVPLGRWVLQRACEMLRDWADTPGLSDCFLAINISALQIQQPDFAEVVARVLCDTGAPAHRLKLELTESLLQKDIDDTISKLQQLRELGVEFALDDFGTGYSSLSLLRRLPIQELKIDRSFVLHALDHPQDEAVARMIVQLADTLGMRVVAEGVETQQQFQFLLGIGCRQFQGYMFGRPEPLAALTARRLSLME